jgi:DNA-binding MarR family transcriptional regulator
MDFNINSSVGFTISTTLNILRKSFNKKIQDFNLTSEQYGILKLIDEFGAMTPTKISSLLERDKATITRIINSLEKKGLITKTKLNNKSFEIDFSSKGLEEFKKAHEVAKEFHKEIRNLLSEEEFNIMLNSLNKIKNYFKDY